MENWNATTLLSADRKHLVHSLHHPEDHAKPHVWVEGHGVMLTDADGHEYIDGLACLWNVYVGHGRRELAEAAAEQMTKLAFANSFVGSSNAPTIQLAQRLTELAYPNLVATFFASGGGEANESAFKTARFYLYRPRFPGHKVDVHAATGSAASSQAARVRAGLR